MIKIIGVIFIILSTSLAGFSFSEKLNKRVKELILFRHLLEEISILIRYKAVTIFDLIDNLKNNICFKEFDFLKHIDIEHNSSFSQAFNVAIDNTILSLNKEDIRIIKQFGSSLGKSDIQGQLSEIELYKESISLKINEAKIISENKAKLYRSLGVLIGSFFAILLI